MFYVEEQKQFVQGKSAKAEILLNKQVVVKLSRVVYLKTDQW